ncbi:Sphingosine N-acyltransferase lac1 [Psilocybe cubensis]|uniref:Sphingosine N-acyltransferase lac1 n=2 Tax=Psilocybe cubensis TaxID=181762 RepID=A0ACB8GFX0_PSICU|nr:Sphingosine N-acyltransferase lac1 [Psilocybe cubensis]KAH9474447.1 Sphingosine N-acyltransferase lac1 [Psilocybe cubensis]
MGWKWLGKVSYILAAFNKLLTVDYLKSSSVDPGHHVTGPFLPQTPLGTSNRTANSNLSPKLNSFQIQRESWSIFVRWAIDPYLSFKLLLIPIVLFLNWELLSYCRISVGIYNPFQGIFLLSGYIPTSSPDDPRYRKSWWDIAFVAYYIVFFSFVREYLSLKVGRPLANYFRLRRESKVDRFAEQTYAFLYFMVFGAWGYRVMTQLPTYWYRTDEFWKGYPEWALKPELKRYYLMQFAYWWQQLLVLVLGLEKPRKDYWELVAHHLVTIWLVGWSYIVNLTFIGNAVFMSMDIPDSFFAFSKLLNYIQWNTAKVYSFGIFYVIWSYFRHYLNLRILWSVWFEIPTLVPSWSQNWNPSEGIYMPRWMHFQVFLPLLILQFLNLFWYYLINKVLIRALSSSDVDDSRSDHGEDTEDEGSNDKKTD